MLHKLAAFHSFIHRLVSLPLTLEISTIKQLASNNKINIYVDGLNRRKTVKVAIQTTTTPTPLRTEKNPFPYNFSAFHS